MRSQIASSPRPQRPGRRIFFLISTALKTTLALMLFFAADHQSFAASDDLSEDEATFRSRKFINLTMGIEQEEKLPPMPLDVEFKGDFRNYIRAEYSREAKSIRLTPIREGLATMTIHDPKTRKLLAEYRIDIKRSHLDKIIREMRALLGDIEGISIKVVNNRVIVDGQILLPRDLNRIISVVSEFGEQASTLVTLSPLAQKKIAEYIARDINNPEVEVRAVNNKFVLQGMVNSQDEKDRAEIIAKTYVPDVIIDKGVAAGIIKAIKPANDGVINLLAIKESAPAPPPKMVQLVIHYVELNKDYSKAFKIGWLPQLSDNSQMTFQTGSESGGVISSITGVISNLLPQLNWAKEHGQAKILESTSVIVQDGKKGEIKQVTNQPYSVIGAQGQVGTAFAEIGIRSTITPVILGEKSGSVRMDMEFALSNLLGTGQNGAPITSNNNISSSIIVRDRQSAAVGGLIRNSSFTDYNRMPANIKNPIISLYASKGFQRKQSQFVVFITPVVKTSASAGSEKIKQKFRLRD